MVKPLVVVVTVQIVNLDFPLPEKMRQAARLSAHQNHPHMGGARAMTAIEHSVCSVLRSGQERNAASALWVAEPLYQRKRLLTMDRSN